MEGYQENPKHWQTFALHLHPLLFDGGAKGVIACRARDPATLGPSAPIIVGLQYIRRSEPSILPILAEETPSPPFPVASYLRAPARPLHIGTLHSASAKACWGLGASLPRSPSFSRCRTRNGRRSPNPRCAAVVYLCVRVFLTHWYSRYLYGAEFGCFFCMCLGALRASVSSRSAGLLVEPAPQERTPTARLS
ncbi:hypothetical protein BC827DRAFT_502817 [Russula dissimulans]|nr:hypothetical protein BC827DRAFT_502817 [Russula dissimulans]